LIDFRPCFLGYSGRSADEDGGASEDGVAGCSDDRRRCSGETVFKMVAINSSSSARFRRRETDEIGVAGGSSSA
jgi:hypothetical protein